jgi:CheY-like chemotaxis protein
VLVIDDDPATAGLFAETLRDEGVVVDCVASPAEALDLLARHTAISVIVTRPFAGDDNPFAWLVQLRARTHAAIVLCVEPDQCAAYQAHGDVAVLELPCDQAPSRHR